MNASPGLVVVGVDGSRGGLRATRFAARAASAAGADLEVVHVVPTLLPSPPVRPVQPPNFDDVGESILEDGVAVARAEVPGLSVRGRLVHGPVVRGLVGAAGRAGLMVLGAEHEGALAHVWTGRVFSGVAARAMCPTVVVPPEWDPGDRPRGRVVVGVKRAEGSAELLALGFAEAASKGADLVILHAWKLPSAYEDIIGARVAEESYRDRARRFIEPLLTGLRAAYPQVRVSIEVRHAQAARALIDASPDADLLVLTRPGTRPGGPRLGSTARAVMRWAACPVIVHPAEVGEYSRGPLSRQEESSLGR